jgi:undecaprenyl phosphate-alpha-L-ara4FN deformylase
MTKIGLRIDVDTLRGTRRGVPALLDLLARHGIRASFFFSVGPDNMGRHLYRLIRPSFLVKMLRTKAASLYGWDILFKGTLWPGPMIGKNATEPIRRAAAEGHEAGLHAWDHHRWQARVEKMDTQTARRDLERGYDMLSQIIGRNPDCYASPAWRITPAALRALEKFEFSYTSDCRGDALFQPVIEGRRLRHPQVPTTLPTYDEVIGTACTPENYNDYMLGQLRPGRLNVLTIHAEAEGIACREMFGEFLESAADRGYEFAPLCDLVRDADVLPDGEIEIAAIPGREGWIARQVMAENNVSDPRHAENRSTSSLQ